MIGMDDQQLVDALAGVWRSITDLGETLSEDDWKQPTELPGWTVQDTLVHLSSIESMTLGRPWKDLPEPPEAPHVKNDFGRHNEKAVHSRRGWSGAAALAEFRALANERLAFLRGLDEEGFGGDAWTPQGPGTVRTQLPFRIFDSYAHEQDMRRAVGRPGGTASPAAAVTLDDMARTMSYVVGKKVAPPNGSSVVFSLSGPLARQLVIEVADGRATAVHEFANTTPTVELAMSTITFERLACGRIDPDASLAAGDVVVTGDADLGRRVVVAMNYMF
jgi:uncharacterized protein (TIGR03083 family)